MQGVGSRIWGVALQGASFWGLGFWARVLGLGVVGEGFGSTIGRAFSATFPRLRTAITCEGWG